MKWNESVLSLKPYQPGKSVDEVKKQLGLNEITKLASNENPYGSSDITKQALYEWNRSFALYPDGYATVLRSALANLYNVRETQLIFGNGSDEIIQIISKSLLEPGKNTVMPTPSFPQYKHNAVLQLAESREVALVEGAHDLNEMLNRVDEHTSVVWLCSPNNPTGLYIHNGDLINFLEQVPSNVLVVLDEAYYEYVTAEDYPDTLAFLEKFPNIIILRTFSKIYGLAGFRVGYGIASEEIISKLEPAREPFNVNSLGMYVAAKALEDQTFIVECKKKNAEGLEKFYRFCNESGLNYYPSQGNFILIDFGIDSDEVFQFLLSKGFIVRSGKALGFSTSIRITVGTEEQNEKLIQFMKEFIKTPV
ncbi:histidinol-phosphate transaminase [Peribacillus alkalitolerans]|uniref:histidinol-phosphate transaminase n=1 Tax=Peribacillus alkalitolerans TaxID=1550385 RepID=UPI0013D6D786|nr:histidinol-phosphate transaminase [Peribacillus alkalitolerans]